MTHSSSLAAYIVSQRRVAWRNMDMDKNMLLVKTIEKFPCLYKSDSVEYMTRPFTEQAWLEVSKETNLTVQECKEKWKNLRYGLLRSLRPTRHGSAKKKYYLHNEMEFLIPHFTSAAKYKDRTIKQDKESDDLQDEEQEYAFENDTLEMAHIVETYSDSEEPINKKARINEIQCNYDEAENIPQPQSFEEDSRRMFLLSLLPEIADLSENQMKTFRRRIFGLIDEISKIDPL